MDQSLVEVLVSEVEVLISELVGMVLATVTVEVYHPQFHGQGWSPREELPSHAYLKKSTYQYSIYTL